MRKHSASLEKKKDMQIKSSVGNWAFSYCAGERVQIDAIFVEGNLAISIKSPKSMHAYL